jgi:hypothetical protein
MLQFLQKMFKSQKLPSRRNFSQSGHPADDCWQLNLFGNGLIYALP